jgi:uncharacterized protein with ParB-like and HNH nuclease domain
MKISTILDKIDEKQLFIPAFQREYVWKREDAKQLVESLIKEYPVGTMLLWETSKPPELKGPYKYDTKQGAIRVLLDGQQRITTLYMLMRGQIPPYYTTQEITSDTRGLYVNLATLELSYYMKTKMENDPLWRNITDVFHGKVSAFDIQEEFAKNGKVIELEELKGYNDNINAITLIKDRDFPEQTIPIKASVREAIDIFYKVNASGVALTDAELALAQISGYWPEARNRFKSKLTALAMNGFVFKLDFIVYVLLGCLYHMGSDLRKLHGEDNKDKILAAWEQLDNQIFDYVLSLLRTNAFVDHSHEISSPYILIPLVVYCFDKNGKHPTEAEIGKMTKWFYYAHTKARYVNQLQQKLDKDLGKLLTSEEPFDDLLQSIADESRLNILPQDFIGHATQHPLFSMMRWYFKSQKAVCFTTGLSLRQNMGNKYKLEWDHIFPYSQLKKAGYGQDNRIKYALAQEMTNRAILTQGANRSKSDTNSSDYLISVKAKFPTALELQCIPSDENLWKLENFEQFLDARRQILAKELNNFLDSITMTTTKSLPVSIEDLIVKGESEELEFKSSLRWDLEKEIVNKDLESTVLKTISAFANSQGGTLLVGVNDEGQILGLQHDYTTLQNSDKDGFELHLRDLLIKQFGQPFTINNIKINFHTENDLEICQVAVQPAKDPIVIKTKDKNSQEIEKIYVRNGNSSRDLLPGEIVSYFKGRSMI